MSGRNKPLDDRYRKIAELVYLEGKSIVSACKEVGLSEQSWYKKKGDQELEDYIKEVQQLKAERRTRDKYAPESLLEMALDNIVDGLTNKDPKITELVLRNIDKLKEIGKKEMDISTVMDLLRDADISIDQIKIDDEVQPD